jgi:hypothetical protein
MTDISADTWLAAMPTGEAPAGPFTLGGEAHKLLFCRTLLETFNPYRPAVIDWPKLDPDARDRLISLPIWDIAVQTEGKASLNVKSYSRVVSSDEWLRTAVDLNAFEEARHKRVLANLVQAYGIRLEPEPAYRNPRDPEWAFMVTGFSECIDSFFAFGLFELARRSGFFPPELVETFEPVMHEEARHILFFVNWVAWQRRNLPWWRRPLFEVRIAAVWAFLAWERMSIAQGLGGRSGGDANFTLTGAQHVGLDVSLGGLLDVCLAENDRRLSPYDSRLIRPRFVPAMARLARRLTASDGQKNSVEVAA